jgi:putative endonuclease
MAKHNEVGKEGERQALVYFTQNGYQILHQNWRFAHWEIDLIASKNNVLHFIEVKTRTSNKYGFPEDEVTAKKMKFLMQSADEYLHRHPHWQRIQYDILSIVLQPQIAYFLIEDVFL